MSGALIVTDAYRRAGLAHNPFCHDVVGATLVDRRIDAPPPAAGVFVQLVGEKGAGKTTLLTRWRAHRPGPYRWVPPTAGRWRTLPVAGIAYWDEIDRAPVALVRRALHRAARAGATVVAGTHVDLGHLGRRAGLRVCSHHLPPLTAADVEAWAHRCLAAAALRPGDSTLRLDAATAERVAHTAGGSWRRAGDLLHAWVATEVA